MTDQAQAQPETEDAQEGVNVAHVNAMLEAITEQRNGAMNQIVQVQAENAMLRQQVKAMGEHIQAQDAELSKLRMDATKDKADESVKGKGK